jgi:hypothetical protein
MNLDVIVRAQLSISPSPTANAMRSGKNPEPTLID